MTREQKNAYQREWNRKNKDKKRALDKKYRETHKEQIKEISKTWREKNREHLNETIRENYKNNPEKFKARQDRYRKLHAEEIKIKNKKYKLEHKDNAKLYEQKRRKEPLYRLKCSIRSLIKESIKHKTHKTNTRTEEILGCTIDEFIKYLESKFKEGMTIENHGKWHIDHIIPISSAKTEEEVFTLNHYTNLQPLWAIDNLKKGNKII